MKSIIALQIIPAVLLLSICFLFSVKSLSVSAQSWQVEQNATPDRLSRADKIAEEEKLLIGRLANDHLIDPIRGYTILRTNNALMINGQLQTAAAGKKYLSGLSTMHLYLEVYPFREWIKRHPQMVTQFSPYIIRSTSKMIRNNEEGC